MTFVSFKNLTNPSLMICDWNIDFGNIRDIKKCRKHLKLTVHGDIHNAIYIHQTKILLSIDRGYTSPLSGVVPYEVREAGGFSSWLSSMVGSLSANSECVFQNVKYKNVPMLPRCISCHGTKGLPWLFLFVWWYTWRPWREITCLSVSHFIRNHPQTMDYTSLTDFP